MLVLSNRKKKSKVKETKNVQKRTARKVMVPEGHSSSRAGITDLRGWPVTPPKLTESGSSTNTTSENKQI